MSDILELIDGAIEDWETSGDAMRWAPDVEVNKSNHTGFLAFSAEAVRQAGFRPRDDGPITATYEWSCASRDHSDLNEVTAYSEATRWQIELVSRLFDVPADLIGGWWRVVS